MENPRNTPQLEKTPVQKMEAYINTMAEVLEQNREGLARYIVHGVTPGSFLSAVLSNDFMRACAYADFGNRLCMHNIASWLEANAPTGCYGSPENFKAWREAGGLEGR